MKSKKILAVAAAAVLLVSTASMPAGAVTVDWTLYKNQSWSESTTVGLYNCASIDFLKNDKTSKNGVNLYLDYAIPGLGYENKLHLFCDPGQTDCATGKYMVRVPSSWKGNMHSWWPGGKDCLSYGRFRAYSG